MKTVTIYTDGACSGNPGPGGYGTVLLYGGARKELYSDSRYVVDAIEKGWVAKWRQNGWMRNKKERAQNVDLWERMTVLLEKHQVSFHWVKGHADNPENERCDELARMAIQSGSLLEDEMYMA